MDGALLGCGESAGEGVEAFDVDGPSRSTRTRVFSPASAISGWNVAAAALREVGATMTPESPSNWSAWTMTAWRGPCCSRPRVAGGWMR